MQALKARVENGRLKLDEPTDLPEGSVVSLEIATDWDDLGEDERAALHQSLRESAEQMKAGQTVGVGLRFAPATEIAISQRRD